MDLYSLWTRWKSIHFLNLINSSILYSLLVYMQKLQSTLMLDIVIACNFWLSSELDFFFCFSESSWNLIWDNPKFPKRQGDSWKRVSLKKCKIPHISLWENSPLCPNDFVLLLPVPPPLSILKKHVIVLIICISLLKESSYYLPWWHSR